MALRILPPFVLALSGHNLCCSHNATDAVDFCICRLAGCRCTEPAHRWATPSRLAPLLQSCRCCNQRPHTVSNHITPFCCCTQWLTAMQLVCLASSNGWTAQVRCGVEVPHRHAWQESLYQTCSGNTKTACKSHDELFMQMPFITHKYKFMTVHVQIAQVYSSRWSMRQPNRAEAGDCMLGAT